MKKYNALLLLSIALIICPLVLFYCYIGKNGFSNDPTHWGVFGDYFGGVFGTIISIITLYLVYLTYVKQTKILIQSQFETSFFSLLNHQNELFNSLKVNTKSDNEKLAGLSLISQFSKLLDKNVLDPYHDPMYDAEKDEFYLSNIRKRINKEIEYCYELIPTQQFSSYFRHLYNILKFVDESNVVEKSMYCNILFAQLSDDELLVNFYNCISDKGYDKYLPLAHKYSMFENIYSRGEIFEKQAQLFFPKTQFKDKNQRRNYTSSGNDFSCYDFDELLKGMQEHGCKIFIINEIRRPDHNDNVSIVVEIYNDENCEKKYRFSIGECTFRGDGGGYGRMEDVFKNLIKNVGRYIDVRILFTDHYKVEMIWKGTKYIDEIIDESISLKKYQDRIDQDLKDRIDNMLKKYPLEPNIMTPIYSI